MTKEDSTFGGAARAENGEASILAPPPAAEAFKDRRVGLVAFGVLQLLIALVILAMGGVQFLMIGGADRFAPPGSVSTSKWTFLVAGVFYLVLGIAAAVLGVGSIRYRRWARALNLVLASLVLALGVLSSVMLGLFLPGMARSFESQAGASPQGVAFVIGCLIIGLAFMYLIVPAAFVFFYRSRHVKATCELHDPKTRWTDRRPLPVLAGSLLLLSGGAVVLTPAMGLGVPLFGWIATGAAGWLVGGVFGLVSVLLAWGLFDLRRWGWVGALVFTASSGLNALVTFWGREISELYEQMQVPADQLEVLEEMGFARWMTPIMAMSVLLMLGFYLWLGKYFKASAGTP